MSARGRRWTPCRPRAPTAPGVRARERRLPRGRPVDHAARRGSGHQKRTGQSVAVDTAGFARTRATRVGRRGLMRLGSRRLIAVARTTVWRNSAHATPVSPAWTRTHLLGHYTQFGAQLTDWCVCVRRSRAATCQCAGMPGVSEPRAVASHRRTGSQCLMPASSRRRLCEWPAVPQPGAERAALLVPDGVNGREPRGAECGVDPEYHAHHERRRGGDEHRLRR